MKYYTTLLGAAGAAADKTREKPDITPKLDMMSMRNDAPRARRTIQVAKKKPLTSGETLIIINVQTSRAIKNKIVDLFQEFGLIVRCGFVTQREDSR